MSRIKRVVWSKKFILKHRHSKKTVPFHQLQQFPTLKLAAWYEYPPNPLWNYNTKTHYHEATEKYRQYKKEAIRYLKEHKVSHPDFWFLQLDTAILEKVIEFI